jgi:hypothetical protein
MRLLKISSQLAIDPEKIVYIKDNGRTCEIGLQNGTVTASLTYQELCNVLSILSLTIKE